LSEDAEAQARMERAEQLMAAICERARQTGNRRLKRDDVASSIGIDTPVSNLTPDAREFLKTAQILKHNGLIEGTSYYELINLTQAGIDACNAGEF
jgi:hypothetical protein